MRDKDLVERRFAKALSRYHTMAVVQRSIAERLAELIPSDLEAQNAYEIGAGSGFLTYKLLERYPNVQLIANDITDKSELFLPSNVTFIKGDGEAVPLPAKIDLIASASTVQWFDDLPEFIIKSYNALNDCGIIAVSTFGKKNFRELGEQLDYYSKEELENVFKSVGFEVLICEDWQEQMDFETPMEVLQHIKATGVNALHKAKWTRCELGKFIANYPLPATLTFHPIIIVAKKC